MNKKLIISLTVVVLAVLFSSLYFLSYKKAQSAYVEVEVFDLASRVSGQIIELNQNDNQPVKKGEILAKIEADKYEKALASAESELNKAQQELNISQNDVDNLSSINKKSENDIQRAKLQLENANSDYIRYKNEFKDGSVTKKDLDKAIKNLEVAREQFKKAQAEMDEAKKALETSVSKKNSNDIKLKKLIAKVDEAKLNLSYTTIESPIDGFIIFRKANLNDTLKENDPILSVISSDYNLIAKFDDTNKIKENQKAIVQIESLKNKKFKGTVVSIIDKNTVRIKFINNYQGSVILPETKAKAKVKIRF